MMSTNDPGGTASDPWLAPPPPPPSYEDQPAPPYQQPYGQPNGQYPPYGQQSGYGLPPAYGYGYQPYSAPQTEGSAIAALIASIVSYVFCPVIPAIVALVLIPGARRKIDGSGGRLTGLGMLRAAKWIAWINIVLVVLAIVGGIALIALGGASTDTSSDFSVGVVLRSLRS